MGDQRRGIQDAAARHHAGRGRSLAGSRRDPGRLERSPSLRPLGEPDPSAPRTPDRIRLAALTLLSRREYTRHELRAKLVEKGATPDGAQAVVTALAADGLVDDRRAAASHIRTATRIKRRGRHRIERELVARGVDKTLVRELLGEVTPDDETAQIQRILTAKRVPDDLDAPTRRRLFQHLMRRGFSSAAILKVLRHEIEDD